MGSGPALGGRVPAHLLFFPPQLQKNQSPSGLGGALLFERVSLVCLRSCSVSAGPPARRQGRPRPQLSVRGFLIAGFATGGYCARQLRSDAGRVLNVRGTPLMRHGPLWQHWLDASLAAAEQEAARAFLPPFEFALGHCSQLTFHYGNLSYGNGSCY